MSRKLQFQNLVLQQTLHEIEDCARQPTVVQPALTLPIKPECVLPLPPARSFATTKIRQESSLILVGADGEVILPQEEGEETTLVEEAHPVQATSRKKMVLRGVALLLSILLVLALYLTWHIATPTAASPTVTQQAYSSAATIQSTPINSSAPTATGENSGGMIQVYIVGAIKHPGVYRLPANARVYQLVQAAGGALPGANLVALNLAARLTDGQEVYVLSVGETPPANYTDGSSGSAGTPSPTLAPGQLVNINTASETEMRQTLHVSATTAQKIIAYRTQHGLYTSVDQLLQVISKSIYDRIKNMVTI